MKIAEMESHHSSYLSFEEKISSMVAAREFPDVLQACQDCLPHILPAMKFRKKREIVPDQLHRELHHHRVNRVNLRKEYFKVDFNQIVNIVQSNFGEVDYVAHPEADQFRQSLEMTDEDQDFVESVFDSLAGDEDEFVPED